VKEDAARTKVDLVKKLEELYRQLADSDNSEGMAHDLEASETRYRRLFESAQDGILILDSSTAQIVDVNPFLVEMLGYTKKDILGKRLWEVGAFKDIDQAKSAFRELQTNGYIRYEDMPLVAKNGKLVNVEFVSNVYSVDNTRVIQCNIRDISQRKKAEQALEASTEALKASEQRYRRLFESAAEGILVAIAKTKQFKYANPAICRMLGYTQEELKGRPVSDIHPKDSWERVSSEFEAQLKGERILSEELPCLRKDGTIVYADVKSAKALLDGVECNVCFFTDVTERMISREKQNESVNKLLKALNDTVMVIAMTVEMKDPYTAGHQKRVSRLGTSIATQMGLSADQIEGIRVAGIVHDIGKMYVPSEILNKPGKLSQIELEMVRMHPKAAYDILKIVDFPWPVAQSVLQHHERKDGSGYPEHLFGDDIILEARILGVSDVVEAMASHRPYRPALGIQKALDEVSQKKGVLYDSEVVDACVRLFKERGSNFEQVEIPDITKPGTIG
jgi:PAS domain S-box-containing protein